MPAASTSPLRKELHALLVLAAPLVLTNLGNMALALVDVAVVGRLGEAAIGAAGLGNAIFFAATLFGLGVLFGLDPLLGQAAGAKEHARVWQCFVGGLLLAVLLAIPLTLLIVLAAQFLPEMGAPAETIALTRGYLYARLPSLAPFLMLIAVRAFLQARGVTNSLMTGVVVANLVNLPLAWVLTLGVPSLGFEGLGVVGAGLATFFATLTQLLVSAWPVMRLRQEATASWSVVTDAMKRTLVLGAPIGLQITFEAGSFTLVTFLIGAFGTRPLSGHQIALSIVNCTFQVALGVGAATSVRVGMEVGRGEAIATRRAGFIGIAVGMLVMTLGSLALLSFPAALARALTDEVDVIQAALPFMFVAACFQLADGAQTVAQGALRGAGDTRLPLFLNLFGHWVLGMPLGLFLTYQLGMGPVGLWWGLSLGLLTVAVLATARFFLITRGRVERV
jgi:MATE family multidrug resistance protein